MGSQFISVFGSQVGEEEAGLVRQTLLSQWLGVGKKVDEFEEKYRQKFGLKNFVMVDSGSNALYMAVKLLDLEPGSEIILPAFTWVSCAQAVLLNGLRPVFCDVDLRTMNVRAQDIQPHITKKTKAIMVVHYAGLAVQMQPVLELGFPVIEDAAHALCSTYKNQPCGSIGTVGIYSFDPVKNLTTGEGGGVTSGDARLIQRAKILRYCGIGKTGFDSAVGEAAKKQRWWEYDISEAFIKMLPTNISASIGLVQLDKIDALQARRKEIWERYQKEFALIPQITTPAEVTPGEKHSYFTYCLRGPRRDELAHYLLEQGIYTTLRYHPLHLNKIYGQTSKSLPNCEQLNQDALSIPLHPRLSDDDVTVIIEKIKDFYRG